MRRRPPRFRGVVQHFALQRRKQRDRRWLHPVLPNRADLRQRRGLHIGVRRRPHHPSRGVRRRQQHQRRRLLQRLQGRAGLHLLTAALGRHHHGAPHRERLFGEPSRLSTIGCGAVRRYCEFWHGAKSVGHQHHVYANQGQARLTTGAGVQRVQYGEQRGELRRLVQPQHGRQCRVGLHDDAVSQRIG